MHFRSSKTNCAPSEGSDYPGNYRSQLMSRCYKTVLCSTKLSMRFFLLINVKMPTIVGSLTFVSGMNTSSDSFKAKIFNFHRFSFYEQLKFHAQMSLARNSFIT